MGLLLFAVALVWLRRQVEATIAVVLSFTLGLVVPAFVSFEDSVFGPFMDDPDASPVRGTVVAIVAAVITLALAWTPARRVRFPALAGAIVALVAIALVAVGRAVSEPAGTAWLLLLVGVAYASAFGFLRGAPVRIADRPRTRPARRPWLRRARPARRNRASPRSPPKAGSPSSCRRSRWGWPRWR